MARYQHLSHRVKTQAGMAAAAHPDPGQASGIMAAPVALVTVQPVDNNYVTLAMQELAPIFTADGAAVAATSPGKWDQLALAGRP